MFVNLNNRLDNQERIIGTQSKKRKIAMRMVVFLLFLVLAIGLPGIGIYQGGKQAVRSGKALVASYKDQNFDDLKKYTKDTKGYLQTVDKSLSFLIWLRLIPILGGYYQDVHGFTKAGVAELSALEKVITIIEPAEKEIGFNGHPLPGQDRIAQVIRILEKITPELDTLESDLKQAGESVKNIDTEKYPEEFRGIRVRSLLTAGKNFIVGGATALKDHKTAIEMAPDALGISAPKTYLILFQNDKEIRATGGFLSAYTFIKLDKGEIMTTSADDIYRLDERLLKVCQNKICPLTPPAPIVKYLPEESGKPRSAWSMRDSNLSPDVPTSAKEFERMYQLLGDGLSYDGIIYVDTQLVEELIKITGPIDILGTSYSAEKDSRCDCPNVVYELESYVEIAAKGSTDRKAILGVLMQQLLAKSLGSDVERLPEYIDTVIRLANHKHIMFYMHDQQLQQELKKLNWIGAFNQTEGDYLHINDSNFAGGKSNMYVMQEVTQEITVQDGVVKKKIVIDYSNPQQFNRWLNGINRDYVRIYVPKGSKLISIKGSEDTTKTSEELDRTVFEAFVTVRPQNKRKLEVEYEIPYQPTGEYKLLIQKQPGAKDFSYKIKLNGKQVADFELEADKTFTFSF